MTGIYVDIPNYKAMKDSAVLINKVGGVVGTKYSGGSINGEYLQVDQDVGRAGLMNERTKMMSDSSVMITNIPHRSELRLSIKNKLQNRLKNPTNVYSTLCARARTIPKVPQLEEYLRQPYESILIENLMNIHTYAPAYYEQITKNENSFDEYQLFIYLLTLVVVVEGRKTEEMFLKMSPDMVNIFEWTKTRMTPDINYMLSGPKVNTQMNLDYRSKLQGLISPSNEQSSVTDYLQLTTSQNINDSINLFKTELRARPNVYHKNPNIAGSYSISIDSDVDSFFKTDSVNNLVVDCQKVDLGSSLSGNLNLKYEEAVVEGLKVRHDSRIASAKLTNLMNEFTMFSIKNLLVMKSTYKTSLNAFDKLFVVFPNISVDGRFNQIHKIGCVQIPGHFKDSEHEKYWEFMPENHVVYKPTTASVKCFDFFISDNPTKKSHILYNNYKITALLNMCYNCPIVIQNIEDPNYPNVYIITMNNLTVEGDIEVGDQTFIYNPDAGYIQMLDSSVTYDTAPLMKKNVDAMTVITEVPMPEPPPTLKELFNVYISAINSQKTHVMLYNSSKTVTRESLRNIIAGSNQEFIEILGRKYVLNQYTFEDLYDVINKIRYTIPTADDFDTLLSTAVHHLNIYGSEYLIEPYVDVDTLLADVQVVDPTVDINMLMNLIHITVDDTVQILGTTFVLRDYVDTVSMKQDIIKDIGIKWSELVRTKLMTKYVNAIRSYGAAPETYTTVKTSSVDWSNYYKSMGLFKPDFDYVIDYEEFEDLEQYIKTRDVEYVSDDQYPDNPNNVVVQTSRKGSIGVGSEIELITTVSYYDGITLSADPPMTETYASYVLDEGFVITQPYDKIYIGEEIITDITYNSAVNIAHNVNEIAYFDNSISDTMMIGSHTYALGVSSETVQIDCYDIAFVSGMITITNKYKNTRKYTISGGSEGDVIGYDKYVMDFDGSGYSFSRFVVSNDVITSEVYKNLIMPDDMYTNGVLEETKYYFGVDYTKITEPFVKIASVFQNETTLEYGISEYDTVTLPDLSVVTTPRTNTVVEEEILNNLIENTSADGFRKTTVSGQVSILVSFSSETSNYTKVVSTVDFDSERVAGVVVPGRVAPIPCITLPINYNSAALQEIENTIKGTYIAGDVIGYMSPSDEFIVTDMLRHDPSSITVDDVVFENIWRKITTFTPVTIPELTSGNIKASELVKRTVDIEKNKFKTFVIKKDVFGIKFSVADFIYSFAKTINQTNIAPGYYEFNDLELDLLTSRHRLDRIFNYDEAVGARYFINHINRFATRLTVYYPNFNFTGMSTRFNDTESIIIYVNDNIFSIDYKKPISEPIEFLTTGSRFKMAIELK